MLGKEIEVEADKVRNTSLRLPNEIRKWLGHRAVENGRSINSEIMMIFKEMMKKEELENASK
ncbi:hypothetical protein CF114_10555 [Aeromonas veronii]|nr:hypothetical protein CF114_10555 [Aeromonas veronii]